MKEVVLHIGMHKTGTSSIQASLSSFDDGSSVYANFSVANHSIPITTIFSRNAHKYHIWKNQGISPVDLSAIKNQYRQILDKHSSDNSRDRLIISGEDIGLLKYDEKRALIDYFTSRNLVIKVICFTRDPQSLAASSIQQHIRGGMSRLTKMNPDYKFRIAAFLDALPKEHIIVRDYGSAVSESGDIVKYMSSLMGIDIPVNGSNSENISLSLSATRLLFRFNRLPISTSGNPARTQAKYLFIDALSRLYPTLREGSRIDSSITSGLVKFTSEDSSFLKSEFGLSYESNENEYSLHESEEYFSNISDVDFSLLVSFLIENGYPCENDISIDQLLIDTYSFFFQKNCLEDSDAGYLRDISMKIAETKNLDMHDAVALMALANRARPTGSLIQSKLKEYSALL